MKRYWDGASHIWRWSGRSILESLIDSISLCSLHWEECNVSCLCGKLRLEKPWGRKIIIEMFLTCNLLVYIITYSISNVNISIYLCLYPFLSILFNRQFNLYNHLSIYFNYLLICPSIYLSHHLSICNLSIYQSIYLLIYLYIDKKKFSLSMVCSV